MYLIVYLLVTFVAYGYFYAHMMSILSKREKKHFEMIKQLVSAEVKKRKMENAN